MSDGFTRPLTAAPINFECPKLGNPVWQAGRVRFWPEADFIGSSTTHRLESALRRVVGGITSVVFDCASHPIGENPVHHIRAVSIAHRGTLGRICIVRTSQGWDGPVPSTRVSRLLVRALNQFYTATEMGR